MLNKLQFNNLVISNKKGIQQARIQTINKLVHKIRRLKTLLEKHPDNMKCKERVRKSTETMDFLKKIKRVDIMKQVLLMDKPPAAIITNGLATPDEVGVALLAMNKVMQVLIKRLKTELKLDDEESKNWRRELKESSKRKQKIERTEDRRRKRLETKEQKAVGIKRQEWIEKNNPGADVEQIKLDADSNVSTVGKWKVEELKIDEEVTTIKKSEKKKDQDLKRLQKEKSKINKTEIVTKKTKEKVSINKIENENQLSDEEDTDEDMDQNNVDQEITIDDHNETPEDCEEEPEESMVVDPFFITDTGENYLSTAIIKRGQTTDNEGSKGHHMIKLNSTKNSNDFKGRRQQPRDWNQQNFKERNNQTRERFSQNQSKWKNNGSNGEQKYQQNERNERFQQNNWKNNKDRDNKMDSRDKGFKNQLSNNFPTSKEQNLHPSWAAKQKLKPVITSFQGKKITFGDNDDESNKTSNTYSQSQNNTSKNLASKPKNSDKDSLHPSWIAKQKLKPTITAFQGKKITFDN